jgi:hypothetical protein
MWKYSTEENSWSAVHPPSPFIDPKLWPASRCGHSAVVWGNYIYVYGGFLHGAFPTSQLWKYHVIDQKWTLEAPVNEKAPPARYQHCAASYHNRLVIFGGSDGTSMLGDTWEFDFEFKVWEKVRPRGSSSGPRARRRHSSELVNGCMLVWGGVTER